MAQAEDDRPLDMDWNAEALETDSFADVVDFRRRRRGVRFRPRSNIPRPRSPSISPTSSMAQGGEDGDLARLIAGDARRDRLSDRPAGRYRRGRPELRWRPVEQVLAIIQSFDPCWVGARDLAECIRIQAREADRYDPAMARLIDNLDLLARGGMAALKRICEVDQEDLADMIREFRAYDPKPGRAFGRRGRGGGSRRLRPPHLPSGWAIELNSATLPRVLVNRRYYRELKRGPQDKAVAPGSPSAWPAPTGW